MTDHDDATPELVGDAPQEPAHIRPAFTLKEAAERTGLAHRTLRRYLDQGRFPNAWQEPGGTPAQRPWMIPAVDLVALGLSLTTADPEPAPDLRLLDDDRRSTVFHMRPDMQALIAERRQADAAPAAVSHLTAAPAPAPELVDELVDENADLVDENAELVAENDELRDRLADAERRAAEADKRAAVAEAVARERADALADARLALRALTAGVDTVPTPAAQEPVPSAPAPASDPGTRTHRGVRAWIRRR